MIDPNSREAGLLKDNYGFLLEQEVIEDILKLAESLRLEAGQYVMDIGQAITHVPLLLEGALKIMREDESGNEMLLYYIERGDTCAFSLSCCMGRRKSEIRAVAEEKTTMLMIPSHLMEEWVVKYRSWRDFVFQSYNLRLEEMLETIDSIAFMRMDERLLKYLSDKTKVTGSAHLTNTHAEIARDLNTSRVVVSRLLKQLERKGDIVQHRGSIELVSF
jgi:CRP/FNR family transcriptional regulator, anaerobic regulatory protein